MKILLVCAGGFSTTMMMDAMKEVVNGSEKLDIADFPMKAISIDRFEEEIDNFDVVLVGPQLNHKFEYVENYAKDKKKPAVLLTSDIYGAMDGATVVKQAIIAYRQNQ